MTIYIGHVPSRSSGGNLNGRPSPATPRLVYLRPIKTSMAVATPTKFEDTESVGSEDYERKAGGLCRASGGRVCYNSLAQPTSTGAVVAGPKKRQGL